MRGKRALEPEDNCAVTNETLRQQAALSQCRARSALQDCANYLE